MAEIELRWLCLSDAQIKETIKNKALTDQLLAVVKIAKDQLASDGKDSEIFTRGRLLYIVARKVTEKCTHHLPVIVKLIVEEKIQADSQVSAATNYVLKHASSDNLNVAELEEACGAGIVVTPEEIEEAVRIAVACYKEQLVSERYNYPTGKIVGLSRLMWADGALIAAEVNLQVQALLGPKTKEDLKPKPRVKKEKKENEGLSDSVGRHAHVKQVYDYFLVLDFEATCIRDGTIEPQEIIEFPVAKLNSATLEVEAYFHKYVRPTAIPDLSDFCTELTGITQEMVDAAEPLPTVLESFDRWLDAEGLREKSFIFVTYGDWDLRTALPNEAANKNLTLPDHFSARINIKNSYRKLTGVWPRGMKDMLGRMQLKLQGRHHSGIDDVKNLVEIIRWILRRGHVIERYSDNLERTGRRERNSVAK